MNKPPCRRGFAMVPASGQMDWILEACLPLGPWVTSNCTFCPSLRVLNPFMLMAEKCANKSSPPSSGVIKPKPFASLNHLTVPIAIIKRSSYKNALYLPDLLKNVIHFPQVSPFDIIQLTICRAIAATNAALLAQRNAKSRFLPGKAGKILIHIKPFSGKGQSRLLILSAQGQEREKSRNIRFCVLRSRTVLKS